jgi:hypothetical protein
VGLFGMRQDFSLDPLAIRQVRMVGAITFGRWNCSFAQLSLFSGHVIG